MAATRFDVCPRCRNRSLRLGRCLQCGFRGTGEPVLAGRDRLLGPAQPRRRQETGAEPELPEDAGLPAGDGEPTLE